MFKTLSLVWGVKLRYNMGNLLMVTFQFSSSWSLKEKHKKVFSYVPIKRKGSLSVSEFLVLHVYRMSFNRKCEGRECVVSLNTPGPWAEWT